MLENSRNNERIKLVNAGLLVLGILQLLMLGALYAQVQPQPHPPSVVAPFAIAPFLSVSISLVAVAIFLQGSRFANYFTIAACVTALVSFGPQKYFDDAFPLIWPAVIFAQVAILAIISYFIELLNEEKSDG